MKLYESKKWLQRQLWTLKKTPEQVAEELGISHMTVRRWARIHKL